MKPFLLLLTLCPTVLLAQLNETFSDGEILNNPTWLGEVDSFIVNSVNQLQLDASVAGVAFVYTQSEVIENASWNIDIRYQFSPSSSNYTRVYLATDSSEPENIQNAVFCDVGRNSDRLELGITKNGMEEVLIQSETGLLSASSNEIRIQVSRNVDVWSVVYDIGNGDINLGEVESTTEFASLYFGLFCNYTVTRAKKFFFDNISIKGEDFQDRYPPQVIDYGVMNGEEMYVRFDEPLDTSSIQQNQFHLTKLNRTPTDVFYNAEWNRLVLYFNPALDDVNNDTLKFWGVKDLSGNLIATELPFIYERVKVIGAKLTTNDLLEFQLSKPIPIDNWDRAELFLDDERLIDFEVTTYNEDQLHRLQLSKPLDEGKVYPLRLLGLEDASGDTIRSFSSEVWYYQPKRFDVVVNEIMVDPTPVVQLPESEYVELYNRTDFDLSLHNWELHVNGKSTLLPDSMIKAKSHALLVPIGDLELWPGNVIPVNKWPSLTNGGFEMVLYDDSAHVMDTYRYQPDNIYGDIFKSEGGWSVERLDVSNLSGQPDNWKWSVNLTGGTPSYANSVQRENKDELSPWHVYSELINDSLFRIHFSEVMNFADKGWTLNIRPSVDTIIWEYDYVFMKFIDIRIDQLPGNNQVYSVELDGITDWEGNLLIDGYPIKLALPDTLVSGDVVINEVLFNPDTDGVDFVELVNISDKVLNLSDLFFGMWDDDKIIEKLYPLSIKSRLLFPGDYLTLSMDSLTLFDQYRCENKYTFLNTKMPSMSDQEGAVIICNQGGGIIDYFEYSDKMHFDLIHDTEGISLERLSVYQPTRNKQNWHSAASSVRATPGYANSQVISNSETEKSISLQYDVFTPNSDGNKDQLVISYANDKSDVIINIRIYDTGGAQVRYLVNNQLMEGEGFYVWDGLDEEGQRLSPGIYIVWCQRVYSSGEVVKDKLVCVIGVSPNN